MNEFSRDSYVSAGPHEAAQLVQSAADSSIGAVMKSDAREEILEEAFGRLPKIFLPDAANGVQAVIHWAITGASTGAETYEMVIENGACAVSRTPAREPKVTMTMDPVTFLKVISGDGNPMKMFMMGKIKAKGDLGLAANVAKYFDIPRG
jgi:hypothetical protein